VIEGVVAPKILEGEVSPESVTKPEGEVSPEVVTKTDDAPPATASKATADIDAEAAAVRATDCGCIIL
jgi:hypothetical protein